MKSNNPLELVENYIGEPLTVTWATRLAEAPIEHIIDLMNKFSPFYYDWLEAEEARGTDYNDEVFSLIDPYHEHMEWDQRLDKYKKFLLYFSRFTILDPVSEVIWPIVTLAKVMEAMGEQGIHLNEEFLDKVRFRSNLQGALTLLADLSPFIYKDEIVLVPSRFAVDYPEVQDRDREEYQAFPLEKLYKLTAEKYQTNKELADIAIGVVKTWGQLCSKLQFSPVAGDNLVHEILKIEYQSNPQLQRVSVDHHKIIPTLMKYEIPGLVNVSYSEIISLRKNEEAFHSWRVAFKQIVDKANLETDVDEKQFQVELREASEDILRPRVHELNSKIKGSSALEKIFLPAALTIGGSAITYIITDAPSVSGIVGASLTPVSWVADKLYKRFNKSGRQATFLRQFYSHLLEK